MKILKTSAVIRRGITNLMAPGRMRRVAITAFVGEGARAFIRKPNGVEIICWPRAGGTNPLELRRLKRAGARIRFADRLHMKVYWTAGRGSIITSANLSTNALGAGNLREFGVLLPADALAIDDVIESVKSRRFNKGDMQRLEREHRKLKAREWRPHEKTERVDYLEWFALPARPEWKLGWWEEICGFSRKAKEIVRSEYNEKSPDQCVSCRKNDYRRADWILSFRLTKEGASAPDWIYVDFTVKVSQNDRSAYRVDYPYQAIQALTPRHYPSPPFAITREFKAALRAASVAFGTERLKRLRSACPPRDLLAMIAKRMK